MTRVIARTGVGIVLCLSLLLPGLANAELSFNRIITFGDSLSDPGSYFLLTGDFEVRPFTEPIPYSPYLIGLFHFSNGPTWIERLAKDLCMPASGKSALLFPRVYTNYAVGRSRARQPGDTLTPICKLCDLTSQVHRFLMDFKGKAPEDALYVVFIGSNDLSDALSGDFESILTLAIGSTSQNILNLYGAGARKFLVLNVPDFGLTPYIIGLDGPYPALATGASWFYNEQLAGALSQLRGLSGIEIRLVDVFLALNELVSDPGSAGFLDVTHSCLEFGVVQGAICSHPSQYLFWDGIHPTTAGHDFLSDKAKEALAAAP